MTNIEYDKLVNLLIEELTSEYPNMTKVSSIIEASDCPYLKKILFDSVKSAQRTVSDTLKIIDLCPASPS